MYEALVRARESINTIRRLVENNQVDKRYELMIFRYDSGIIDDLLSDLDEAIAIATEEQ